MSMAIAEADLEHPHERRYVYSAEWATAFHKNMNRLAFEAGLTTWQ